MLLLSYGPSSIVRWARFDLNEGPSACEGGGSIHVTEPVAAELNGGKSEQFLDPPQMVGGSWIRTSIILLRGRC